MEVKFNVTGTRRKEMAEVISGIVGMQAVYMRMPTCAYAINNFKISKEGVLIYDERSGAELVEKVLTGLKEAGFTAEEQLAEAATAEEQEEPENTTSEPEKDDTAETAGLTVEVPSDKVAVGNLNKLLEAKGSLIKKALGLEKLPIEMVEDKISFPWFAELPDAETAKAYTHLISALCEMSKNQKRITAKEKEVANEKYAFRCFLLRLGFIGGEYKEERKILLKNLTGSSAFRNGGTGHEVSE